MGGKSSQSSSQVTIPPEILARYNSVNAQAQNAAEKPFQQYSTDPTAFVAPVNAQESTGISGVNAAANQAQPYFGAATNTLMGAYGNTQPLNAMAEYGTAASSSPLTGQQINQYLSPYLGTVLGSQEQLLNQQNQQAMAGQLGNAISSGAFGGDRAGIAAANLNQQQNLANANIYSNILNQGYNQALQTAQGQQQIGLAGANQLANIGNLAFQQGAGTSQALAGLGTGAQGAALQGAQAQIGAGQLQQQTTQAGDTALYNQFLQQQSYPFQVSNFLAGIAEGTGALSGSTTTGTTLNGYFSDERLKENIKEVGKTHDGQPIYSYKMKGDPRTQMGLIAQEVEERHPEAVGVAGGYKTVDYGKALKDASMGGHVGLAHAGEEYARGGYAGGGYSTTLTANPGGFSDASMVSPNDLAAIIQAQQQMYVGAGGPTAYGGLAGGPPHGGAQGYVPTTSMPAAHLQTASLPKQGPSGAEQLKQVNEAANSMKSLYNTGKAGLVGTAEDKNHNATAGLLGSGGDWSTVKSKLISKLFGPSNDHVAADQNTLASLIDQNYFTKGLGLDTTAIPENVGLGKGTGTSVGNYSNIVGLNPHTGTGLESGINEEPVPAANEEPEPAQDDIQPEQDDIQPEQDNAPLYRGGVAGHMHYAGGGLAGRGMYADGGSGEDPYANEDTDPYTEKPKGLDIEESKNNNKLTTAALPSGQGDNSGQEMASMAATAVAIAAMFSRGGVAGGRHGYAVDGTVSDGDQSTDDQNTLSTDDQNTLASLTDPNYFTKGLDTTAIPENVGLGKGTGTSIGNYSNIVGLNPHTGTGLESGINQQGLAGAQQSSVQSPLASTESTKDSTPQKPTEGFMHKLLSSDIFKKENIIPALQFFSAMGTAPTRHFGVALAAGAQGLASGLQSQQQIELQKRQMDYEGQRIGISQQQANTATLARLLEARRLMQAQMAAYSVTGAAIDPSMKYQLAAINKRITELGGGDISAIGKYPSEMSGVQQQTPISGATTQGQNVSTNKPVITADMPKDVSAVTTETGPTSSTTESVKIKKPDDVYTQATTPDPNFYSQLADDKNPLILRERAKQALWANPNDTATYQQLMSRANQEQSVIDTTFYGVDKNGNKIFNPQAAAVAHLNANAPENAKFFDELGSQDVARQKARANLNVLRTVLENYQSGRGNESLANLAGFLRTAGFNVPKSGLADTASADEFVKGMMRQVFSDVSALEGPAKVAEIQGLQRATANPQLDPKANREIISQALGALDFDQKHSDEAYNHRNFHNQLFDKQTFEKEFNNNYKQDNFINEERKHVAVRGDVNSYQEMKPDHEYIVEPNQINGLNLNRPARVMYMGLNPNTGNPQYKIIKYL